MKTLVTGGAGFIGSNLVKLLHEKGHEVCVLDNLHSGFRVNLDPFPEVEFIEGDIRDAETVERVMEDVDIVFHLAASVGNTRSIHHPILDSEINVIGTLQVLEAMRKHRVPKIVCTSSASIFGELKTLPIREDHPLEPDSPYGASKLAAEKLCLAYGKLYPIEVTCLRYFNVYGVNQRYDAYGNVISIFAYQMFNDETLNIYGDGEQTRDFINVKDVARANYLAGITKGISGAFNLGSGTTITINKLLKMMIDISRIEPTIAYKPERIGDIRHSRADITAIKNALGFQPEVGLEEGLKEYLEWVKPEVQKIV